jgi:hypothetical protein
MLFPQSGDIAPQERSQLPPAEAVLFENTAMILIYGVTIVVIVAGRRAFRAVRRPAMRKRM